MKKEEPKTVWEKKTSGRAPSKNRPECLLSCAISLDGKLASITGDSSFSSFRDKKEVHKLRTKIDAILVGINTSLEDDPHLTVSHKYYKSNQHPLRIVLDSKARLPTNAKFIKKRPRVRSLVATTEKAPKNRRKRLEKAGADVRILGKKKVSLPRLMKVLASEYEIEKLMVEGGGNVIGNFFKHDLIDTARISITPVVLGGGTKAVDMVSNMGFPTVKEAPRFELTKIELIDYNIILHLVRKE